MADVTGRTLFRPGDLSPLGYWKLDEAANVTRVDSGSGANNLTDVGGDLAIVAFDYWNTGENSADFELTTLANHLDGGDVNDQTGAFTLCAWIKLESVGTNQYIVGKTNATTGYALRFDTTGDQIALEMAGADRVQGATALVVNRWYHVAAVYDQTNVSVYVDGNVDGVAAYAVDVIDTAHNFVLGAVSAGTSNFDGLMKDAAIWNSALTPLQIKSLALGQNLTQFAIRPDSSVFTTPTVYWPLNEAVVSGTRSDSIGALDLTDNGTVPTLGGYIEGAGASFDGSADFFSTADNTAFDFSGGTFSISAWIKADTVAGTDVIYQQSTDANNHFDFQLEAGILNLSVTSASSEVVNVVGTTTLVVGVWYHVAVTENGNAWLLYLDGVDDTTSGGTDTERAANYTGDVRIGTDNAGANDFDGLMADVAVWKGTALTATEVQKLATGLDMNTQGFVSYWKLDAATAASEPDSIGANTLTNSSSGTGVTSVTGQVNEGKDFAKADLDLLEITDASQVGLDLTREVTLMVWYKPEENDALHYLLDKGFQATGYLLSRTLTNNIEFACGGDGFTTTGTFTTTAGEWVHAVGILDLASKKIYINGGLSVTRTILPNAPSNNVENFILGTFVQKVASQYAEGIMDEAMVAARFVGEEEVKAIYLKGLHGLEATNSDTLGANSGAGFFALL